MSVYSRLALLLAALGFGLSPPVGAEEAPKGKICYSRQERGGYYLHVMDADGKNDRELPGLPGEVSLMPAWSPDGKQIAFMSGSAVQGMEFGLYLMAIDGSGLKRLAKDEKIAAMPAWAPDGKTLLFVVDRNDAPHLMAINADGTGSHELATGLPFAVTPFFSPDGKKIGFTGASDARDPKAAELYIANADGSDAAKLSSGGGPTLGGQGAWSPDGKTIALASHDLQGKTGQVKTIALADKAEKKLADVKVGGQTFFLGVVLPSWSPDGQWLTISQAGDAGNSVVWRISADGKTQERLTPADASCHCPAWSHQ